MRIHDLRHSLASRALELGEGPPMIGNLLGHAQVRATARHALPPVMPSRPPSPAPATASKEISRMALTAPNMVHMVDDNVRKDRPSGREPVREWLVELPREDRRLIGRDIMRVEFGCPCGPPLCASLTNYPGLHEVRSNLTGKRIARVFFTVSRPNMVLLHGFIKKSQAIRRKELMLAQRRMKEHDRHV